MKYLLAHQNNLNPTWWLQRVMRKQTLHDCITIKNLILHGALKKQNYPTKKPVFCFKLRHMWLLKKPNNIHMKCLQKGTRFPLQKKFY